VVGQLLHHFPHGCIKFCRRNCEARTFTETIRALVERTNAWLKYFRKLRYRWERKKCMFQAMVELACLLICLRRVEV